MNKRDFTEAFINVYLANTSRKDLKVHHVLPEKGGFLWMACCKKLVEYSEGNDAKADYDKADKIGANMIFFESTCRLDVQTLPLSHEFDTSLKIEQAMLQEYYVVGKDFSWCYMVTHEGDACGPFFIKRKI